MMDSISSFFAIEHINSNNAVMIVGSFLLLLLPIISILFERFIKKKQSTKKPFDDLPMAPHSHWLFGHIKLLYDKENFPSSYYKLASDFANTNGHTGYWIGTRRAVAVQRLADVKTVLGRESNRSNIPIVSHYLAHIAGETNLLMLNGREWKIHRDAVTRTFTPSFLKQAQQDVYHVSQDLVQTFLTKINQNESTTTTTDKDSKETSSSFWLVENIQPITRIFTMDCIGRAAFSTNFDCCKTLTSSPVVQAFEFLMKDYGRRMKSPLSPLNYFFQLPTQHNQNHQEQFSILRNFIDNLLTTTQTEKQQQQQEQKGNGDDDDATDTTLDDSSSSNNSLNNNKKLKSSSRSKKKNHNLLTRLVAAHEADVNTDEGKRTLIDVMSTILFASYDTTSTALTFALYLLATHPDVQDQCVEEINSVLLQQPEQETNGAPPLSKAEDLVYITAVVKETLRLFPPAYQVSRTLTKPIALSGGFVAPPGIQVGIPIWVIHHDEEHFPKPDELRPERWVTNTTKDQQHQHQQSQRPSSSSPWVERNYREEMKLVNTTGSPEMILAGNPDAFLPFSTGGRNCPGSRFALQETVIVLANLLRDLKFTPVPGFELKLGLDGIMPTPKDGMPLRVHRRR